MDVNVAFFVLTVSAIAYANNKEVEIIETKTSMKVILESSASIWEPQPPQNDSYVLGQFAHNTGNPPSDSTELYVARSVDGSLAAPVDFSGPWLVLRNVGIWSMVCPRDYVSLGAIATRGRRLGSYVSLPPKPDKSKYRCVHKSAAVKANPVNVLHRDGAGRVLYGSVNSSKGLQTPFFVVTYANRDDTVYAIRKSAVVTQTDLEQRIIPKPSPSATSTTVTSNQSTLSSQAPTSPPVTAEPSVSSMGVKVAIAVLVSATVLSVFLLACCIWHKKKIMKIAPSSVNTMTTTTNTTMNNESDYEMVRSVGSDLHLYGNPEAEVRENILYEQKKEEREIRSNILYHGMDVNECDYAFATEVTAYRVPEAERSRPNSATYQNVNIYATPAPV